MGFSASHKSPSYCTPYLSGLIDTTCGRTLGLEKTAHTWCSFIVSYVSQLVASLRNACCIRREILDFEAHLSRESWLQLSLPFTSCYTLCLYVCVRLKRKVKGCSFLSAYYMLL